MRPEFVAWILDELNEGYQEPPGVRPVHNEALEEDTSYLLLEAVVIPGCVLEEVQEHL